MKGVCAHELFLAQRRAIHCLVAPTLFETLEARCDLLNSSSGSYYTWGNGMFVSVLTRECKVIWCMQYIFLKPEEMFSNFSSKLKCELPVQSLVVKALK